MRIKDSQIIEKLEHIKNILRLLSRIIDILVLIVELYYIQKEIDHLVSFFFFLIHTSIIVNKI